MNLNKFQKVMAFWEMQDYLQPVNVPDEFKKDSRYGILAAWLSPQLLDGGCAQFRLLLPGTSMAVVTQGQYLLLGVDTVYKPHVGVGKTAGEFSWLPLSAIRGLTEYEGDFHEGTTV